MFGLEQHGGIGNGEWREEGYLFEVHLGHIPSPYMVDRD